MGELVSSTATLIVSGLSGGMVGIIKEVSPYLVGLFVLFFVSMFLITLFPYVISGMFGKH